MSDALDKWQRPGSRPVFDAAKETGGGNMAVNSLLPYKPFSESTGAARLWLRPGNGEIGRAFPYGYLTDVTTDDYGQIIGLTYSIPFPGPVVVQIEGKGLLPLAESIVKGNVVSAQAFDPSRHANPQEDTPVISVIHIIDKPPEKRPEDATQH